MKTASLPQMRTGYTTFGRVGEKGEAEVGITPRFGNKK
jgi:hypothetical protein